MATAGWITGTSQARAAVQLLSDLTRYIGHSYTATHSYTELHWATLGYTELHCTEDRGMRGPGHQWRLLLTIHDRDSSNGSQ